MNTPPHRTQTSIRQDLGPLAWIQGEMRQTYGQAMQLLEGCAAPASQSAETARPASAPDDLLRARIMVHQAAAALEMVGVLIPALILRTAETVVARMAGNTLPCTPESVQTLTDAGACVCEYLENLVQEPALSPVLLFPAYRAIHALSGAAAPAGPADLWQLEAGLREPEPTLPAQAISPSPEVRQQMDRAILSLMRGKDSSAAAAGLTLICLGLAAGSQPLRERIFWKVAAGFFEGISTGLIPTDIYVKRAATRVLVQYAALIKGDTEVTPRWMHDLLFFCSQAERPETPQAATLHAVQSAFGLLQHPRIDYDTNIFNTLPAQAGQELLAQLDLAADGWAAIIDDQLQQLTATSAHFHSLQQALGRHLKAAQELGGTLALILTALEQKQSKPSPVLALEVATALIYLRTVLTDARLRAANMPQRIHELSQRLRAAASQRESQPLPAWMEEQYSRASDSDTMRDVVRELQAGFADAENRLDMFLRDPARPEALQQVPDILARARGALAILDMPNSTRAIQQISNDLKQLLENRQNLRPQTPDPRFERIGSNLAALGLQVEMLAYQPSQTKELFIFDALSCVLSTPDEPQQTEETERHDLSGQAAQAAPEPQQPAITAAPKAPHNTATAQQPALAAPQNPPPAPAVAGGASDDDNDDDDSLLDIFLEEAREVVASGQQALAGLSLEPHDLGRQTSLRRAFHTLKGSSRMVGLQAYGEAAWAMEQLLNVRLAEQKPLAVELRSLAAQALSAFSDWADAIAAGQPTSAWSAQRFQQAASAMRERNELLSIVDTAAAGQTGAAPAAGPAPVTFTEDLQTVLARLESPQVLAVNTPQPVRPAVQPLAGSAAARSFNDALLQQHWQPLPDAAGPGHSPYVDLSFESDMVAMPDHTTAGQTANEARDLNWHNTPAFEEAAPPEASGSTLSEQPAPAPQLPDGALLPSLSADSTHKDQVASDLPAPDDGLLTPRASSHTDIHPDAAAPDALHQTPHAAAGHADDLDRLIASVFEEAAPPEAAGSALSEQPAPAPQLPDDALLPALSADSTHKDPVASDLPAPDDGLPAPRASSHTDIHPDAAAPDAPRQTLPATAGHADDLDRLIASVFEEVAPPEAAGSDLSAQPVPAPQLPDDALLPALSADSTHKDPVASDLPATDDGLLTPRASSHTEIRPDAAAPDAQRQTLPAAAGHADDLDRLIASVFEEVAPPEAAGSDLSTQPVPAPQLPNDILLASLSADSTHKDPVASDLPAPGDGLLTPQASSHTGIHPDAAAPDALRQTPHATADTTPPRPASDLLATEALLASLDSDLAGAHDTTAASTQAPAAALPEPHKVPGTPTDAGPGLPGIDDARLLADLDTLAAMPTGFADQPPAGSAAPAARPQTTAETAPAHSTSPLPARHAASSGTSHPGSQQASTYRMLEALQLTQELEQDLASWAALPGQPPLPQSMMQAAGRLHIQSQALKADASFSLFVGQLAESISWLHFQPPRNSQTTRTVLTDGLQEIQSALDGIAAGTGYGRIAADELTHMAQLRQQAPAAEGRSQTGATDSNGSEADSIDPDLFPIFDEEAVELLPRLIGALRRWAGEPASFEARSAALRVLHTLKGSSRLAGARLMGDLSHHFESEIEAIEASSANSATISALFTRYDELHAAFEALRSDARLHQTAPGTGSQAEAPRKLFTGSADSAAATAQPQETPARAPDTDRTGSGTATDGALYQPTLGPTYTQGLPGPAELLLQPNSKRNETVRVRSSQINLLINQAGEIQLSRGRAEARLRQLNTALDGMTVDLDRLRQQLRELELQTETEMQSRLPSGKENDRFDPLELDRFTRVQELTRMMAETVNDVATVQRTLQAAMIGTEDDLQAQERKGRELQRDLLNTRMVEFDSIAERLHATVRQACADTGKQAELVVKNGAIEMDRVLLDQMIGGFEHILRNCVAHGIEPPARRESHGKARMGQITLTVEHEGNDVALTFSDDGAGLNLEAIRRKAVERGLLRADQDSSDQELTELIYLPGISTAGTVSDVAGRGIGMDVVRVDVATLGGRIETSTRSGAGTSFRLVVPLTTAITQVMLVRAGKLVIGIPANLLESIERLDQTRLEKAYAQGHLETGGQRVSFFWAGAMLQHSTRSDETAAPQSPVVLVRSAAQLIAVHVDEVLGNQEVVVKNLGPQLSSLPGLAGMSVLPSGAILLVYNFIALANAYGATAQALQRGDRPDAGNDGARLINGLLPAPAKAPDTPLVLVVDDSITVRRVTQRLLRREGYRVALAADGVRALEALEQDRPAIVLSDIEMPQMDGFELLKKIRSTDALADLPVVMITSRTAQKHRDHASDLGADHYLGKPYSDAELLGLVHHYARIRQTQQTHQPGREVRA